MVFGTDAMPLECGPDTEAVVYFTDDMESGTSGWSHGSVVRPATGTLDSSDAQGPVGLMPLVSYRNQNTAVPGRFQSIAEPLKPLAGPWMQQRA